MFGYDARNPTAALGRAHAERRANSRCAQNQLDTSVNGLKFSHIFNGKHGQRLDTEFSLK